MVIENHDWHVRKYYNHIKLDFYFNLYNSTKEITLQYEEIKRKAYELGKICRENGIQRYERYDCPFDLPELSKQWQAGYQEVSLNLSEWD